MGDDSSPREHRSTRSLPKSLCAVISGEWDSKNAHVCDVCGLMSVQLHFSLAWLCPDAMACLRPFREDWGILAKWTLEIPQILGGLGKGNSSRTRTWHGFCNKNRQTVSTWTVPGMWAHQGHQTWIQSKPLVMVVYNDCCLSTVLRW